MHITIPETSLVLLIGAAGAGKSTFAARHFMVTEIVSSDRCRAMVSDDENSMDANDDAFALLHVIVATRLRRGRLTVVDATNVVPESRKPLLELARAHRRATTAVVLDMPAALCIERNAVRRDRTVPAAAVRRHVRALRDSLPRLQSDGLEQTTVLHTPEEVDGVRVERVRVARAP